MSPAYARAVYAVSNGEARIFPAPRCVRVTAAVALGNEEEVPRKSGGVCPPLEARGVHHDDIMTYPDDIHTDDQQHTMNDTPWSRPVARVCAQRSREYYVESVTAAGCVCGSVCVWGRERRHRMLVRWHWEQVIMAIVVAGTQKAQRKRRC